MNEQKQVNVNESAQAQSALNVLLCHAVYVPAKCVDIM